MPYESDAQRKAVWASRNERGEKGPIKKTEPRMFSPLKNSKRISS